ncbi:MAG: iron-only hydrogenase system regulator [Alphaproteobacteria bacterium]|nr:iron-only hydrogenase system regulator [Alphaproteobacteria bacterium]
MEKRLAMMAIAVSNSKSIMDLNALLHEYGSIIIGRMGIPNHAKGVNLISVALDATNDEISSLSGKIGQLDGITVKTVYAEI